MAAQNALARTPNDSYLSPHLAYKVEMNGVMGTLMAVVMNDRGELEQLRAYLLSDERHGYLPSEIEETYEPATHNSFTDWLES